MRLWRQHRKSGGMPAQRPSQILGIAKLGEPNHVEIGVAIRLGHRLPGERFSIAGTTIADEPVHRGDSAGHLAGDLGVWPGIGAFRRKELNAPAKQIARFVTNGGRRLEIEKSQVEKRKVAAIEHDFGIVLAPAEMTNPVEYGVSFGLIPRRE